MFKEETDCLVKFSERLEYSIASCVNGCEIFVPGDICTYDMSQTTYHASSLVVVNESNRHRLVRVFVKRRC